MDEFPIDELIELFREFPDSYQNPIRFEGLINDKFGSNYKKERHLLVNSLKNGVLFELLEVSPEIPFEFISNRIERKLIDTLGVSEKSASWTVNAWDQVIKNSNIRFINEFKYEKPIEDRPVVPIKKEITKKQKHALDEIIKNMVLINHGSFIMGNRKVANESYPHKVVISVDFQMSKFILTQKLWKDIMGYLPPIANSRKGDDFPIINVSYYDILDFLKVLNSMPGGGGFDLPTEAQWEYACRAGSKDDYSFGSDVNLLSDYAWSKLNSQGFIQPVGMLKPNRWGLYDMHGLMFEICKDGERIFGKNTIIDPIGPMNLDSVVSKGGAFGNYPLPKDISKQMFRCSFRGNIKKDYNSHRDSYRLIRKIGIYR